MVNIHLAYSQPINPSTATPILSREQIWKGLQRKIRHATEFVPVIVECDIVSDKDGVVERVVAFQEGGPAGKKIVREVCTEFAPVKVDFNQEDGSTIQNVVSEGPWGTEADLHMTYVFEWRHPEVQAGGVEEATLRNKHFGMAKMAVNGTIEKIRKLVIAGEL